MPNWLLEDFSGSIGQELAKLNKGLAVPGGPAEGKTKSTDPNKVPWLQWTVRLRKGTYNIRVHSDAEWENYGFLGRITDELQSDPLSPSQRWKFLSPHKMVRIRSARGYQAQKVDYTDTKLIVTNDNHIFRFETWVETVDRQNPHPLPKIYGGWPGNNPRWHYLAAKAGFGTHWRTTNIRTFTEDSATLGADDGGGPGGNDHDFNDLIITVTKV